MVSVKISKGTWGDSPLSEVITVRPSEGEDTVSYYGINEYGTFRLTEEDVKAIMAMEGKEYEEG